MARMGRASRILCLVLMGAISFFISEIDAMARAGKGGSYGNRGSRPLSPPSRSYSTPSPAQPSQQQRQYIPPSKPTSPSPSPFWHGLAGGILGGLIGGMLLRGFGFAGPGTGAWGGPGLFDLILIGALLYGIYWFVSKRRRAMAQESVYSYGHQEVPHAPEGPPMEVFYQELPQDQNLLRGLEHIRQMDPGFQVDAFLNEVESAFFRVQGAWCNRDMGPVRDLLTDEMFSILQGQVQGMREEGKVNRIENLSLRGVEVVEAWQEYGQDFITVRVRGNGLDYTIDEATGQILSGDDHNPTRFEEYWTFTRPVGPNKWRLSAITQPQAT